MQAEPLCEFLLPMLRFDPRKRATAAELLRHPWLREEAQPSRFRRGLEEGRQDMRPRQHRCEPLDSVVAAAALV
jgi:serine/threonine protein kinase